MDEGTRQVQSHWNRRTNERNSRERCYADHEWWPSACPRRWSRMMPYTVANYPEYRKEWARIKAQSIPALSASLRGSIDERIEIDFLEARRKALRRKFGATPQRPKGFYVEGMP